MDLEIAYIKYNRGLLLSPQLPIIATQALVNGYDSHSLVLLASQREPSMAEAGPLFEVAMKELGIKLPEKKKSSQVGTEYAESLSTDSTDFLDPVYAAFRRYGEMLILQRFAYTAGAGGDWHLVKHIEQWQKLLDSGRRKTAYTVILEPELPIRGIADSELLREAVCLFDSLGDLMIAVLPPDCAVIDLYSVEWSTKGWKTKDAEDQLHDSEQKIYQFFERYKDAQVAIGRDLTVWKEDIAQITGYIPDEDGVARPGAY